jgi:hypothetical protein
MKIIDLFRNKIILFIIQILILSLFIFYFGYQFNVSFNTDASNTQKRITQFILNYVLFNDLSGLLFIYFTWILVSIIAIFLYNDFKKAYTMNIMTFFFPNFFGYVFLHRYSKDYFKANFSFHFLNSILLIFLIIIISIGFSLILKRIRKVEIQEQMEDLQGIINQIKSKCPNCGTEFNSTPMYCYNCEAKLILKPEENVGVK